MCQQPGGCIRENIMKKIDNIKIPPLPVRERRALLEKKIKKQLGKLPPYRILRRSVDARKKDQIFYVYSVGIPEPGDHALPVYPQTCEAFMKVRAKTGAAKSGCAAAPVIVGAGPAGLFAGLLLARAGLKPLLLEQGAPVEERMRDVEAFWNGGDLKPYSNVQFGEGGAGTFSDGKLNTGIKDPSGRIPFVLRTFAEAGAPEEITYDAKPHIGTDVLPGVVKHIREEIISLGGCVRFHCEMTALSLRGSAGQRSVAGICVRNTLTGEESTLPAETVILAPGHSSRRLLQELYREGVPMEPKAFAVGVRVQHPQAQINQIQYGDAQAGNLPTADYKLTAQTKDGRGVYSFCMCPGGQVVNASSEPGRLCVNGMSRRARDGKNANAALIVQVRPEDFTSEPALLRGNSKSGGGETLPAALAGMAFQRKLEEAAYLAGGGRIPLQLWKDFESGRVSSELGAAEPDICGAWRFAPLHEALPDFMREALKEAMPQFDTKMPGFAREDAILCGTEARTSSPVIIRRDEHAESPVRGLFPCGEGAGYAGGITSAAVDGLKTAEEILRRQECIEE